MRKTSQQILLTRLYSAGPYRCPDTRKRQALCNLNSNTVAGLYRDKIFSARDAIKKLVIATGFVVFTAPRVDAAEWFVEGGGGAAYGHFAHVEYNDPIGSIFAANPKEGPGIIPQVLKGDPWSGAAALSIGYLFDERYFVRASYRYFGTRSVAADGIHFFNPRNFQQLSPSFPQSLTATAHGAVISAGIEQNLKDWFVDVSLNIGASPISSGGTRDIGTILQQPFPSSTQVNLVYGAGIAIGHRLSPNLALTLAANWDHLGRADTGLAPDIGPGPSLGTGAPPYASMTAKLDATSIILGLRYSVAYSRATTLFKGK